MRRLKLTDHQRPEFPSARDKFSEFAFDLIKGSENRYRGVIDVLLRARLEMEL